MQQKGGLKELQLTHNVFKNMQHLTRPVIMITIMIPNNIVHLSPSKLQNWCIVPGWPMYCFSEMGTKSSYPVSDNWRAFCAESSGSTVKIWRILCWNCGWMGYWYIWWMHLTEKMFRKPSESLNAPYFLTEQYFATQLMYLYIPPGMHLRRSSVKPWGDQRL